MSNPIKVLGLECVPYKGDYSWRRDKAPQLSVSILEDGTWNIYHGDFIDASGATLEEAEQDFREQAFFEIQHLTVCLESDSNLPFQVRIVMKDSSKDILHE